MPQHSCGNWVDFVKSGCEKSWAEVQADSFSFECRGCAKMKGIEVEIERLRQLIAGIGGKGRGGLCQWFRWGGGQWMIKCGEAMRGMLGRAHLSLRGGREKVRRQDVKRREGLKTMVGKAMGAKETGRREMGERRRERRRQE